MSPRAPSRTKGETSRFPPVPLPPLMSQRLAHERRDLSADRRLRAALRLPFRRARLEGRLDRLCVFHRFEARPVFARILDWAKAGFFRIAPLDDDYELEPHRLTREEIHAKLDEMTSTWAAWADRCTYHGPYREQVVRSALVLKALTNGPTGAIVAAATTSRATAARVPSGSATARRNSSSSTRSASWSTRPGSTAATTARSTRSSGTSSPASAASSSRSGASPTRGSGRSAASPGTSSTRR